MDPASEWEWAKLANIRIREAALLLQEQYYNGAEYFFGHSAEAALKALYRLRQNKNIKGHNLRIIAEKAAFPIDELFEDASYFDSRNVSSRYELNCTPKMAKKANDCADRINKHVTEEIEKASSKKNLAESL